MAAAILAFTALFIGLDIAERPIALWDESRLAVNALEMRQRGFSLVTTYGFAPDLWNTKPPLLIWLQAGAIDLFGAREWAIRLPSLLAAVATAGLTLRFAWRLSASLFVMAIAGLALVVSGGFYGYHAAMTGDYDALLALFVTGYLLLLFELLHRRRPSAVPVIACGLLVAAACLTKGVAGLVPGAGVAVYVLARWRWRRLFETPWYGLAALLAVAIVGGFYAAREATAAGYLGAVMTNELGGRYLHGLGGHTWPAYYYPQMLAELFAFGPAFALPLLATALPWRRTPSAAFLTYANVITVVFLLVLTLGRTKIYWYLVPIYPVLSIAFAVAVERILVLTGRWGPRWAHPLRRPARCAPPLRRCGGGRRARLRPVLPLRAIASVGGHPAGPLRTGVRRARSRRDHAHPRGGRRGLQQRQAGRLHAAAALLRPCLARARPRYRPRRSRPAGAAWPALGGRHLRPEPAADGSGSWLFGYRHRGLRGGDRAAVRRPVGAGTPKGGRA
jgi:hypothetical protein